MKKILLMLMMGIFLLGFVSAASETLGTFKQNEPVRITQVCFDSTYINISSIAFPNSTTIYNNTEMISAGSGEFYFVFNETSTVGNYDVRGISDGCEKTFAVYFTITPTGGIESNTTIFLFLIIISVAILMIAFVLHNYIFSTIAGFAFMSAGMYGMIYGFADITSLYTQIMSYIIIGFGIIITVTSGLELMKEMSPSNFNNREDDD